MEITIGSKWQHKDESDVYIVTGVEAQIAPSSKTVYLVWYAPFKEKEWGVFTYAEAFGDFAIVKEHFLDSFKPYEPVYEYQWAKINNYGNWHIACGFFTNEEMGDESDFVRVDFTKRERPIN